MSEHPLDRSIAATNRNVERLAEDARWLFDFGRYPSAYAFAVLAQEEAAKVYLLDLIRGGAVPWNDGVKRAIHDHTCKQLLVMVLDYLNSETQALLERLDQKVDEEIPDRIRSALNIFRHEKVGAFIDGSPPCWMEPPNYEHGALRIAEGKWDNVKQDAIYVRLGKNGELGSEPHHAIVAEMAEKEIERAERLRCAVHGMEEGRQGLWRYDEVREIFRMLFTDPEILRQQGILPPRE